jgi:hypothetical protein
MPYLYEWPISVKHVGKLTCDQCNKAAEYTFLIQKKTQKDDHVKHFCCDDRVSMTSMYEALTGCKIIRCQRLSISDRVIGLAARPVPSDSKF